MNTLNLNEKIDDFWVFPKLTTAVHSRAYNDDFFSFLNHEDKKCTPTTLYIHVPFCKSSCTFCPYYKVPRNKCSAILMDDYVSMVIKELSMYGKTPFFRNKGIETVHFGGGDPLLLDIKQIERIVKAVNDAFTTIPNKGWSIEGTVSSIKDEAVINRLLDLNINRISFGVQTFNKSIRKKMNMKAGISEIYNAADILKKVSPMEFCIDMMYNLPDQTVEDFLEDLSKAIELAPSHIDIFNTILFPNTYIYDRVMEGDYYLHNPSNKNQFESYVQGRKFLLGQGYKQLITTTFAKQDSLDEGEDLYLNNKNMLGVGPSSCSYIDGYSFKNVSDLALYQQEAGRNHFPCHLAYHCTEEEHNDRTMVFFPILMKISKNDIPEYSNYEERINEIVREGLAEWNGDVLMLTEKGISWSGNISKLFVSDKREQIYDKMMQHSLAEKLNPYNEDMMGQSDE